MADKIVSLKVVVDTASGTAHVEDLNEELRGTVDATQKVGKQGKENADKLSGGFVNVGKIIGKISPEFAGMAGNINNVSKSILETGKSLGGLKGAIAATGIGVLVLGLAALVKYLTSTEMGLNFLNRTFPKTIAFFTSAKDAVKGFLDSIGLTDFGLQKMNKTIENLRTRNDLYINELQAMGGKEKEIYEQRSKMVKLDLLLLEKEVKSRGKASDEQILKKKTLISEQKVLDIEYDNFLKDKSKEKSEREKKEREERLKKEREWMETVKQINKDLEEEYKKGAEQAEKNLDEIFARNKQLREEREKRIREADEIIIELGEIEETGEFEAQKRRENELAYDLKVRQDHANKLLEIERKKQENIQFYQDLTMQGLGIISTMNEVFANKSEQNAKKAFENNKKIQIAEALISTYFAAQKAYASQIIPLDPTSIVRAQIAAGVATISGLARVAKIKSMKYDSASSSMDSGGGASGLGGGVQSQSTGLTPLTPQSVRSRKDTEPVKVYVTETDIRAASGRVSDIQSKAVVK